METALSRFSDSFACAQGTVTIDLQRLTEAAVVDFKWEVTYNSKPGQAGPLAYKSRYARYKPPARSDRNAITGVIARPRGRTLHHRTAVRRRVQADGSNNIARGTGLFSEA